MGYKPKRIPCPSMKAEGTVSLVPFQSKVYFDTEIIGPKGCHLHIWLQNEDHDLLEKVIQIIRNRRDIITVTYSDGEPTGFWNRENLP